MFFPLVASSDDRSLKGCVPLALRNVIVEPQPQGAGKRAKYGLSPTMGRVSRATPFSGVNIRGVFARPGVCDGALFVAAGSQLYSIDTSWTATALGPIQGATGTVLFDSIGSTLVLQAGGSIYEYTVAGGLQINTDPDCPTGAFTLASLAERVLTSVRGSDTFDWSSTGNALDWPATGFAASARLPDEIRAQVVVAGDLWHFGASSAQVWRAMGGEDSEAFDILNLVIDRGIAGRDAYAKMDSSVMWVGDDRVVYILNGYTPQRTSNREVEQALEALTDDEMQSLQAFSYLQGSHLFWVLRLPTGKAYAYDAMTQTWCERTSWGHDRYQPCYYTYWPALGKHIVASDESDTVWSWETDVYDDDGDAHERIFSVHIPFAQRTMISSLCVDIKAVDQPLGTTPNINVTFYTDGGSHDSIFTRGVERQASLGGRGSFNVRPMFWRLGMVKAADGMVIKMRITDATNFLFSGVWINERPI